METLISFPHSHLQWQQGDSVFSRWIKVTPTDQATSKSTYSFLSFFRSPVPFSARLNTCLPCPISKIWINHSASSPSINIRRPNSLVQLTINCYSPCAQIDWTWTWQRPTRQPRLTWMNLPQQFGLCEAVCVPHPSGEAGPRQTLPLEGNDSGSPSPSPLEDLESDCSGGATGHDTRDRSIACGGDEPRRHFLASHNSYHTTSLGWCGLIIQK